LQTRHGGDATQLVAEEFGVHMKKIEEAIEGFAARHAGLFRKGIRYAFDPATFHEGAKEIKALPAARRLPGAPKSPDLQKVIEHCHALVKMAYAKALQMANLDTTREELVAMFDDIVTASVHHEGIKLDIESLLETYEQILESEGYYPASGYR
jgi:hypothetical protein